MAMHKYSLAVYYFKKAINTVQKAQIMDQQIQKQGIIQSILSGKLPILQHNLSLALYQNRKYIQSYEQLCLANQYLGSNFKVWYRMGAALLNDCHQYLVQNYQNSTNGIYHTIRDKHPIMFSSQVCPNKKQSQDKEKAL